MKRTATRLFAALRQGGLLLLALLCLLTSCAPTREAGELTLLPNAAVTYGEKTRKEAEAAVLSLLLEVFREEGTATPPPAVLEDLRSLAAEVTAITAREGLPEGSYLALHTLLQSEAPAALRELRAGTVGEATRALYLTLCERVGTESLGRMTYALACLRYDRLHEKAARRYEQYGYPHYRIEAERLAAERETLRTEVGEGRWSVALSLFMTAGELASLGREEAGALSGFSPAEMLVFLRRLPLCELTVGKDGWELLLTLTAKEEGLMAELRAAGDLPTVAALAPTLLSLVTAAQGRLTEADAALLASGDTDAFLGALLSHLTDSEWATLDAAAKTALADARYEEWATATYGEEYLAFRTSLIPLTQAELREAAARGAGACDAFVRYLGGYHPAIAHALAAHKEGDTP